MRTISGLYDTHKQASLAVSALDDAGISRNDISVISPKGGKDSAGHTDEVAAGAGIGATIGGAGGLLAGLAAFAVPGIGPVTGVGWLATTLFGAAAGGIIGSLTGAGIDEKDAHVYAESVKRGRTLVMARVDESQADAAKAILDQSGSADASIVRGEYEADGWGGFTEEEEWERDPKEEYERSKDEDPIISPFPR